MKIKNVVTILLCAVTMITFALFYRTYAVDVVADTTNYLTVEQYTDTDKLLKADGTTRSKTIREFASEVKAAPYGTRFDELAEVIPAQYLNSTEPNAVYQYNGKEYGFYVVKETVDEEIYFDVLLIDFIYEFDDSGHTQSEYKICIKPILQQSFLRVTKEDGRFTWQKLTIGRYRYYVKNPRFLAGLENENALNYGDPAYSKNTDDGIIIKQTRVNYSETSYMNVLEFISRTTVFAAKLAVSYALPALLDVYAELGNLPELHNLNSILDLIEFAFDVMDGTVDIVQEATEKTIEYQNETNIHTAKSKAEQLATNQSGFSRLIAVAPATEGDVYLTDVSNSYAELITELDNTNYQSRLTQLCEFDIARRPYPIGEMREVDNNLRFGKERILFEDADPQFEIPGNNFDDTSVNLYLLPNGKQTVKFRPQYTGDYTFTLPTNLSFSLNGVPYEVTPNGKYTMRLNKIEADSNNPDDPNNDRYEYITITNNSTEKITDAVLNCKLNGSGGQEGVNVAQGNHCLVGYTAAKSGLQQLTVNSADCTIRILNDSLVTVKEASANNCYYNFSQGQKYYFLITNNGQVVVNATVTIQDPLVYDARENYTAAISGELYVSYDLQPGTYGFEYSTNAYFMGCLQNLSISEEYDVATDKNCRKIFVNQAQRVTFIFNGAGMANFTLYNTEIDWIWEVNGKTYLTETATVGTRLDKNSPNTLYIKRGDTVTVRFKIGSTYCQNLQKGNIQFDAWGYTQETRSLYVDAASGLTLDNKSNVQVLEALDNNGIKVSSLYIHIISDITNLSISTYQRSSSDFGLRYSKVSTVPTEKVYINLKIQNRIAQEVRLNNNGGVINFKTLFNVGENIPAVFSVIIKSVIVNNSTSLFSTESQITNQIELNNNMFYITPWFESGRGISSDPFVINNYTHLVNVGVCATNNYHFVLRQSINATGNIWTPIPSFYGKLDGQDNYITGLRINVTGTTNVYYGLFGQLYGIVTNVNFSNVTINSTLTKSDTRLYVGTVAGYVRSGYIEDCEISGSSNINVKICNSSVGGFAGFNQSTVKGCDIYAATFHVSGEAGGVVGRNNGNVTTCNAYDVQITYYWDEDNGKIGGIVGYNRANGRVSVCYSDGLIKWTSPNRNNHIYPALGYTIGYNDATGACTDCNTNMRREISYYYWHFPLGYFDQSGMCFKFEDGKIGWQES